VYPWVTADFWPAPQPTDVNNGTIFFTDLSFGATSWLWNFGDALGSTSNLQNPSFTYTLSGSYTVTEIADNQYGCADTAVRIIIIEEPYSVYVPNAFTPNGDGINEIFFPDGVGIEPGNFEMLIYDRWGTVIYKTTDSGKGWDGRANGGKDIAQNGVYVYLLTTHSKVNGAIHRYIGHVTLLK